MRQLPAQADAALSDSMQLQRSHTMSSIRACRACRALARQARQRGNVYAVGGECDTVQQKRQSPDSGRVFCQAGRASLVQPNILIESVPHVVRHASKWVYKGDSAAELLHYRQACIYI